MANAYFVVQVNAVPGEDAELNRWYEDQHLNYCLTCDTAIAAQRFREIAGSGPWAYAYLALYEAGDPQRFAENRRSTEGTPLLPRSSARALPAHAFFYHPAPGQGGLLDRPERRAFYIEFCDLVTGGQGADSLAERQSEIVELPWVVASELMLVHTYQERKGWHSAGIIFAQISEAMRDRSPASPDLPPVEVSQVVEAGLYEPISERRTRR